MKIIGNFLFILFISIVFAGCGTTKGYTGEKIADDDLATIYGSSNEIKIDRKNYREEALIAKIDSLEVGNYFKGWPENVKVVPGEHIVEVRHLKPWDSANAYIVGDVFCGVAEGTIAGIANKVDSIHYHYFIRFSAEKNQSYRINIKSNPDNADSHPTIEVMNITANKIIPHISEENKYRE